MKDAKSQTWFWISPYGRNIFAVQVASETENTVSVVSERAAGGTVRANKVSSNAIYYRTWGEAYANLLDQATRRVESLHDQLERAKDTLGDIKGMRAPTPAEGAE